MTADVVVVGGGMVGLSCAAALADRALRVTVLGEHQAGEASPAAAGMLAPDIEGGWGAARQFAVAARDRFPSYLAALAERSSANVALLRNGILELVLTDEDLDERRHRPAHSVWLDREELRTLEPALGHALGALLHPDDGAVDNVALISALRGRLERDPRVRLIAERVTSLALSRGSAAATATSGTTYSCATVVLAAGAWAPAISGLPRPLPIEPVRGQMVSVAGTPIGHVTFGPKGYLVPRPDGRSVVGSTMEHVGFDPRTTAEGEARVLEAAAQIYPEVGRLPVLARWAGLRPVTPDLLPIIGRDPDTPTLVYACGHSRNGILLAPITGDCVAAIIAGEPVMHDLSPFAATRFAR